jgi:hypothetical protein
VAWCLKVPKPFISVWIKRVNKMAVLKQNAA